MLWYGFKRYPNLYRRLKNKRNRMNLQNRYLGSPQVHHNTYPSTKSLFQVPASWGLIVLSQKDSLHESPRFYLFNKTYFINFSCMDNFSHLLYDIQTRTLVIHHLLSSESHTMYLRALASLLRRFSLPFFLKIKFKGKGYYMYKSSRNTIAPQFGYAHRVYVYAQATSVKFLSKTKVIIFGLSKSDVLNASYGVKSTKPINIFTGRGVRFARQVIYRKTGKVSSYR